MPIGSKVTVGSRVSLLNLYYAVRFTCEGTPGGQGTPILEVGKP